MEHYHCLIQYNRYCKEMMMVRLLRKLGFMHFLPLVMVGMLYVAEMQACGAMPCHSTSQSSCCATKQACDCILPSSNHHGMAGCPCDLAPLPAQAALTGLTIEYSITKVSFTTTVVVVSDSVRSLPLSQIQYHKIDLRASTPPRAPPFIG